MIYSFCQKINSLLTRCEMLVIQPYLNIGKNC